MTHKLQKTQVHFLGPELSELLVKEVLATCQVLPYTYFSYLAMVDRYTYRQYTTHYNSYRALGGSLNGLHVWDSN